jgi:hypothetical protein
LTNFAQKEKLKAALIDNGTAFIIYKSTPTLRKSSIFSHCNTVPNGR